MWTIIHKCFTINAAWRSVCWCCVKLRPFPLSFFSFYTPHHPDSRSLVNTRILRHLTAALSSRISTTSLQMHRAKTTTKIHLHGTTYKGCSQRCGAQFFFVCWRISELPSSVLYRVAVVCSDSWFTHLKKWPLTSELVVSGSISGFFGGDWEVGVRELSVDDSSLIMWLFTPTQCLVCDYVHESASGGFLSNINQTIWVRLGV